MGKAAWKLLLGVCGTLWMLQALVQAVSASCYNGEANVLLTQFWIPRQGTTDVDDNGNLIPLSGPTTKKIVDEQGGLIAKVDKNTYSKCNEEGTCFLKDGRLLNLGSRADVFQVVDTKRFPFGIGAYGNPLVPFVSVASNDLPRSTKLFVKALRGLRLPNGKVHNGCVRVDDMFGGQSTTCHLDFFLPSFAAFKQLTDHLPENTPAAVAGGTSCKILNYV